MYLQRCIYTYTTYAQRRECSTATERTLARFHTLPMCEINTATGLRTILQNIAAIGLIDEWNPLYSVLEDSDVACFYNLSFEENIFR